MRDRDSTNVEAAAYLARMEDDGPDPDADFYDPEDLECTHCGGEGLCWDGSDPLGKCPDEPHPCHACYGSGKRKDQWLF